MKEIIYRNRTRLKLLASLLLVLTSFIGLVLLTLNVFYFEDRAVLLIAIIALEWISLLLSSSIFLNLKSHIDQAIYDLNRFDLFVRAPNIWLGMYILDNEEVLIPLFCRRSRRLARLLDSNDCKRIIHNAYNNRF